MFLNATTADGYNPYRISRAGIDWEVPEPDNPWANIGYWSDHQIIYLLRLLETSAPLPSRPAAGTARRRAVFTHADVPYRIAHVRRRPCVDPISTIDLRRGHARSSRRGWPSAARTGAWCTGRTATCVRVTLAEKLLLLLLAKLVNLVPDGGIWMNTQRPEWNDANNALVGRGLSVVTLAQLRRYLEFVRGPDHRRRARDRGGGRPARRGVAGARGPPSAPRARASRTPAPGLHGRARRRGTDYRERVYAGFTGRRTVVTGERIQSLLAQRSRTSTRACGPTGARCAVPLLQHPRPRRRCGGIRRLPEMLEGQVAILASGLLEAEESLALLSGLRASALYRADQHSYLLYPDKDLPGFLDRNRSRRAGPGCPLVGALVEAGDRSIVVRDGTGDLHFAAGIRNARDVEAALDRLAADPDLGAIVGDSRAELLEIFEDVFSHAEFTGRSGSFFAYEGLGSIYWHMVSKLLLAVQETLERAVADGEPSATVRALLDAYEDVRAGLGYCKSPEVYGAFPTDPYSHTPAGHGARQPGMTGQVKEEVLTRLGELGLRVEDGARSSSGRSCCARRSGVAARDLRVRRRARHDAAVELPDGSLAFTFCQVPVVYPRGDALSVRVVRADGTSLDCAAGRIAADLSARIFERRGEVSRIEVRTPAAL